MPLKIEKADRRLLIWAALIFVPLIVALALLSSDESDSGDPSSYSAQASGSKAAYLLLQDMGYKIERWEQSPIDLAPDAQQTVLVLVNPFRPPSSEEKDALQLYLNRGGKILITGSATNFYLPHSESQPAFMAEPVPQEYQPQLVTSLTRGGAISMSPSAYWKHCSTDCLVHYADDRSGDARPIVVSYQVGKGQVIWWAASTPLNNGGISRSGNVELLLNSIGPADEIHVLWDEYFHGSQRTAGSYFRETPVLLGLAQGALAMLALLLTYSRRNGPIYPPDSPSRLSPLEFVETLGGLYRRAHVTRAALEVPYLRFRMLAARQLGTKTDVPAPDLARAIRNRLGYKDDSLQDLLVRIEAALYDPELQEAAALELVQQLHAHARRLQLIFSNNRRSFLMQTVSRVLTHGRTELAKVIVGQEELINQCLLTILCGGHALLEGVPGIAKTLVIKCFARLFALEFRRVQCTSDLMPADIIGSNVLNLSTSTFSLHRGPLFTDVLLADEVNRMPPRTQAALLEAMEERQITIDGVTHPLSAFFTVFATQNPVEFEGTYPLPEAQLDRFLLKIKVSYPEAEQEITILENHHAGFDAHNLDAAHLASLPSDALAEARAEVRNIRVEPALFRYMVEIARRTRDWPALSLGASPRAAVSLMMVAKATAALEDRDYLVPDDVKRAVLPVLRHRVIIKPEAELEGLDSDQVLNEILGSVEVPK